MPKFVIESSEDDSDVIKIEDGLIATSLSGWKLEIFKCASSIKNQVFTLAEINQFENQLRTIYPQNKHIIDKIRQQLQYLRDLGLIEFLGNGRYKNYGNEKL